MFMEALAVLTITVPFLIPLMANFGIDPVHLGVVLVLKHYSLMQLLKWVKNSI
jgi:TRAP-type C4-dicarboxylate transport system permease large subunit